MACRHCTSPGCHVCMRMFGPAVDYTSSAGYTRGSEDSPAKSRQQLPCFPHGRRKTAVKNASLPKHQTTLADCVVFYLVREVQ